MKIRWLAQAVQDLEAVREHIAQDNPTAAQEVAKRILRAIERLPAHPALGRPGRVSHTRELIIPKMPYIVPYRVKKQTVEILRVLHAARQWPDLL